MGGGGGRGERGATYAKRVLEIVGQVIPTLKAEPDVLMCLLVVAMGDEVHRKSVCCRLVLKGFFLVSVCRVRQHVLL